MITELKAPFPYFGGKSLAAQEVWDALGDVKNYVEPFVGSAAMLLAAPKAKRIETINDYDGMVANFWRAISHDPEAVAKYTDWPVNEVDLFARHLWLVEQKESMTKKLHTDPEWFDAKIAGYWCWGLCNWIGHGFCSGDGPWGKDGDEIIKINGRGINKQIPHLGNAGQGINKQTDLSRKDFIFAWFDALYHRLRDVRVCCGDWKRVLTDSVTTRHGLTGIFLDPPYTKGNMDYGSGGMGLSISDDVRKWCIESGANSKLRIVLCGHAGEHDELLSHGWTIRTWKARKGYATTAEAVENSKSETLWCSPNCLSEDVLSFD